MRQLSLLHWGKRWFWRLLSIFTVIAVGVIIANIVDAYPYWRAVRRIRSIDENSLRMIAELCAKYEKNGHQRLSGATIPPELRFLHPVRVSFYPGSTDISLLETETTDLKVYPYVFLRISTHSENQIITAVDEAYRGQHQKNLWEKNPAFSQQFRFNNRVATLTRMDMHSACEWIVLPDELVVLEQPYQVGLGSKISKRIPITSSQKTRLNEAISGIGSEFRGHAFDSGGCDGITLYISFTSDGSLGNGVILANAWRKEAAPLIEAVYSMLGEAESGELQRTVEWLSESSHNDHARSFPLKPYLERQTHSWLPWWRLWPRFDFLQNKGST